jgi:hypothetical protein
MTIDYDPKGKIFTNIIVKESIRAAIQTTTHYIVGDVHIRQGGRFKDELDGNEPFLAVTNATVKGNDGTLLFKTGFIAVQRNQVVWSTPLDEMDQE